MNRKINGILLLVLLISNEINSISFSNIMQKKEKKQKIKESTLYNQRKKKIASIVSYTKPAEKGRFLTKSRRTKFEPITTAILLAVSLGLSIINFVVGYMLDKFLIQKNLDQWKRILADTFLAQRLLKEEFCHEIRYLNSIMLHIYNINEFRTVFEFYSIYHRIKTMDIALPAQLPSYAFLLQIIDNSKRFMSESEEYFCQNSYDFFGEQAYISNRLNALSNTQEKPSLGGPIWNMLVATVKKTFLFLIDDTLWDQYIAESNLNRPQFISALDWYNDVKQEAISQEINLDNLACTPNAQLKDLKPFCITSPNKTCSKIILNEAVGKFFGYFKGFMNNFHQIKNFNEVLQKFCELREFLNISFNLYHNIITVTQKFSKTFNLPQAAINSEEKWKEVKSSSFNLANMAFSYVQNLIAGGNGSQLKKTLKEFKNNCKNVISKGVMSIFKPIAKLQIKKYFWRVYNGIKEQIRNFFTLSSLAAVAAKQIATKLLELVLTCLLVGLIINIVTGVIKIIVTIVSKIKKYLGDVKDKKAEIEFLKNSLIPNVELHIQYTKCNFYVYFHNFMESQLISLTYMNPKLINYLETFEENTEDDTDLVNKLGNSAGIISKTPFQNKGKKSPFHDRFISKNKKRTHSKQLDSEIQDSMYLFLDAKCKQNAVFCRLLISSNILSFFVSEELAVVLKEKIFYFLNAGPISRIMKIEPFDDEKKFNEKYLFQNNFSMHSVTYLGGDELSKNVGFIYCRSCSDYILVQDSYKELPYNDVIKNIGALDQAESLDEDYNYRMYFSSDASLDSVSTYLRKAKLNNKEVVQVYAFGYKQLINPNDTTDEYSTDFSSLESVNDAINSIYFYLPVRKDEKITQSIVLNLVMGDLINAQDLMQIKHHNFDFNSYEWANFPSGAQYKYHEAQVFTKEQFKAKKEFDMVITNLIEYQVESITKVRAIGIKVAASPDELLNRNTISQTYDKDFVLIDSFENGKLIEEDGKSFFIQEINYENNEQSQIENDCDIPITENTLSEDMTTQINCVNKSIKKMLQAKICLGCVFEVSNFPKYERFLAQNQKHFLSFVNYNWATTAAAKMGKVFAGIIPGNNASKSRNFVKENIDLLYGTSDIAKLEPKDYKIGQLYNVDMRGIPLLSKFKENFLNLDAYRKPEFINDNFIFAFHKFIPKTDKTNKVLKGKYFFNIDQMKKNNLFSSSFRMLLPVRLSNLYSTLVYRLSHYKGEGQAMVSENCIYEVIEKFAHVESSDDIDSEYNLNDEIPKDFTEVQEKDFVNMAAEKISNARGMTNINYKRFSKVPLKSVIYVEFMIGKDINPMNYRSEFYDKKNTIVDNLIAVGYMPMWPEFSPEDSKFVENNVKGYEVPNSGNYFMIFWVRRNVEFAFRFWIKYDYQDFTRETELICAGYKGGLLKKTKGVSDSIADYQDKRKLRLKERSKRVLIKSKM